MSSSDLFEAVSHPLRIEIIKLLAKGPKRFADIKRELKIDSSGLLDFHLKKLDDLISVNNEGFYVLTDKGAAALQAIETISRYGWQRRAWYINLLFNIIMNIYVLLTMPEYLPYTITISVAWMTFYSYLTFIKRRISIKPRS
ncbi:MAG: winged helix-turn-helix domain-containing protein [archaeon YNP-LCB-024-027]|jgi:DNA-binding HxlR family transcriptional regulator|nr:winged helix-turn-helix domain-containing protein [Candidatus Culexarchaeum yellowstonense]